MIRLYMVEKQVKVVSTAIVFTFGKEVIYMFGVSDYEYCRDMLNHLQEWQSMKDARDQGRQYFDLWGVTMRNDPGQGIKRYKLMYHDHIDKMAGTFNYAPSWIKKKGFNVLNKIRRKLN